MHRRTVLKYLQVERPSHHYRDADKALRKERGHHGATSSDQNTQASVGVVPSSRINARKDFPKELQLPSQCSSPRASSRDGGIKRAKQRSREFLVLTLGFLRCLVESASEACRPPYQKGHSSVTKNHQSGHWEYGGNQDGEVGRELLRSTHQPFPPMPQPPTPPWDTIAMGLRQVRVIDAEQGVHGRLRDALGPTLLGALARLIVRAFLPPSSENACRSGRSQVSFDDSTGKGLANVSEFTTFLGSTVRDILWRNRAGSDGHDDDVIADRQNSTSDGRVIANGNPASDSVRDGTLCMRDDGNERGRSATPGVVNSSARDINRSDLDLPSTNNVCAENPSTVSESINWVNTVVEEAANIEQHAPNSGGDSSGGYSGDTFQAEDFFDSSCRENLLLGNGSNNKHGSYKGHYSSRGGDNVVTGVLDSTIDDDIILGEPIAGEGVAAAEEQGIESTGDGSVCPPRDCLAALAEMQRVNNHLHIPGLVDDARAFANKLACLANVVRSDGSAPRSSEGSEEVRWNREDQPPSRPDVCCWSPRTFVSYHRPVLCSDTELDQYHEGPDHKRFRRKSAANTDRDSADARKNSEGEMYRVQSFEGIDETSPSGARFIDGNGTVTSDGPDSSFWDECSTLTPAFYFYDDERGLSPTELREK